MFFTIKPNKSLLLKIAIIAVAFVFTWIAAAIVESKIKTIGCSQEDLTSTTQYYISKSVQEDNTESGVPDEVVVKKAYLTFDDGPSKITQDVLATLKQYNVKASFFVIAADNNEKFLPILKQTVADGHCIALHSCTHSYKSIYQSPEAFWKDIDELKVKLAPYVNTSELHVLRFPGGSTNTVSHKYGGGNIMKELKEQAVANGYKYVDWNSCAEDATGAHPSAERIAQNVISTCKGHNTVVVLMHDTKNNANTVAALPTIINWLSENGYEFDTVDNLDKQI